MFYVTSENLLNRAAWSFWTCSRRTSCGAEDLQQLQRAWELQHRILTAESVARHTLFRQETRWPGY